MYGMASGASVSDLFLAGIIPGILISHLRILCIINSLFLYKSIQIKDLWGILVEGIRTYTPILFILAALLLIIFIPAISLALV